MSVYSNKTDMKLSWLDCKYYEYAVGCIHPKPRTTKTNHRRRVCMPNKCIQFKMKKMQS